ncbi:YdcH family protein [Acidicapsa ligni]|uniref:YdcH family protein n=1 Tax=Acidicapsa ligni TaxID=542300 RepID=UPI0021E03234|nr:YdcH family protein [Acidicapsa ligni]
MDEPLEAELNAEIGRLLTEHRRYSSRLDELVTKPYLSTDEQLEEVRLKKLKLHAKDLISALEQRNTAVA